LLAAILLALPAALRAERRRQPPRRSFAEVKARLKAYPTPYYVIYTDLEKDVVREAAARMTCMAREYQNRTRGFPRRVRQRLPFYLFSSEEDYRAAGGLPGTAGVYTGKRLMALASRRMGEAAWGVVQHEGFHQYVDKAMSRRVPIWLNEGMAEYFSHGVWTGDSYVVGVIPPHRLKRLKAMIDRQELLGFLEMLGMSSRQWDSGRSGRNYMQAWAMVHFLVHADDEKYRDAFNGFITDVAVGRMPWEEAFMRRFGRDVKGFQERFCEWWSGLPEEPTADLYTGAVVETLMSFFARSFSQGQKFEDIEEFFEAAREDRLEEDPKRWLPRKLLLDRLAKAEELGQWKLINPRRIPSLELTTPDGTTFTAAFKLTGGSFVNVRLEIDRPEEPQPQEHPPAATQPVESN
jgi:hypothetical protein